MSTDMKGFFGSIAILMLMFMGVLLFVAGGKYQRSKDDANRIGPKDLPPLEQPETNSGAVAISPPAPSVPIQWKEIGPTENIEGCQYVRWIYHFSGYDQFEWLHRSDCTNCWARMEKLIKEAVKEAIGEANGTNGIKP